MKITTLSPSRWQEYKNLRLESLKEEPQAFGTSYEDALKDPDEKWIERIERALKEETDILYFAEDKGQVAGLMGAFFKKNEETRESGMVYGAYVRKNYRGRGIGRLLLAKVLERLAIVDGVHKARLMVSVTEKPAKRLYEHMGFEVIDTTDWVLGDGNSHKLLVMEKLL